MKRRYKAETYWNFIKKLEDGFSYKDAARELGVNKNTAYAWKKGSLPHSIRNTRLDLLAETNEKIRRSKLGSKNPMWKGDNVSAKGSRSRAREKFCCPTGKEIHHKDGNPYNNNSSNIMFVTRKEHMNLDGRINNLKRGGDFKYAEIVEAFLTQDHFLVEVIFHGVVIDSQNIVSCLNRFLRKKNLYKHLKAIERQNRVFLENKAEILNKHLLDLVKQRDKKREKKK